MPISTTEMNNYKHNAWCKRLDVEDFKVDYFANVHPDEIKKLHEASWQMFGKEHHSKRNTHPPVIKWKRGGVWYSALVPIETKTEHWHCLFAGGSYDVVDWELMASVAEKIITEA